MSQNPNFDGNAFDFYVFDCDGEAIYHQYQFSNVKNHSYSETPSLSIGKWYAVVLASDSMPPVPYFISGRTVANGKISDGGLISLHLTPNRKQTAYMFYIKATRHATLDISAFELAFGNRSAFILTYHIPGICFHTNITNKTYFSFYPSCKKFKLPVRQSFL